jgi:hypothetical protein
MLSGFRRAASRSFPQITDSEPDSISGLVYQGSGWTDYSGSPASEATLETAK